VEEDDFDDNDADDDIIVVEEDPAKRHDRRIVAPVSKPSAGVPTVAKGE
jgi:hypothetical protein